jgi:hypothetical protein
MDGPDLQRVREADLHGRSVELVVDGQSLLIAHVHVHSIEPIGDLRIVSDHGQALGKLPLGGTEWPVYCLDGSLDILDRLPANRRACVLLKSDYGGIGVLCDEVRVIDNATFDIVPIPACMQSEQKLMEALAVIDAKVICVLDGGRLSATLRTEMTGDGMEATPLAAGEL